VEPIFFNNPSEFRKWLEKHHKDATEVFVGFHKVKSGVPSMTWPESVDEALCFGWIDGVRKSIDENSYMIRFTPRKPSSIWSNVNIKKFNELSEKGQIKPEGLAAFEKRTAEKSGIYSFENEALHLLPEYEGIFMGNDKAWNFFKSQPPSYKKWAIFRIMSAKQEKTQRSRLQRLIECSANGYRMV
jgi:uncharacterized protein YdeI (YjbR/CyaY-like superfamily)